MPSNNITSPTKRSASSQRAPPDNSVTPQQSPPAEPAPAPALSHNKHSTHKPHRPHVVSHRPGMHGRNPSLKNVNRLHRLAAAHNYPGDGDVHVTPALRHHQRKKSAPASPATSPRVGQQQNVRWNGSTVSLAGQVTNPGIKKNLSTPALRNASGILVKKNSAMNKAAAGDKAGQKKSVGFELAASDDDEWEDNNSSYSPDSTRRNSLVTAKMSADNSPHSTLPATKSPLAQASSNAAGEGAQTSVTQQKSPAVNGAHAEGSQEQHARHVDQDDIASRLLHHPHSSKAPPAITSVSATATPPAADRLPHPPSFPTLPSSRIRTSDLSGQWSTVGSSPSTNPHGTSSSIEGGVSRFLTNNANYQVSAISDSDLNTPSSFLPHYHPNTPPSPETANARRPTSRGRQQEPPSRTQQKLWLQRTAVLTTSPPDPSMSGPSPTVPPSALEPTFIAASQSRPGSRSRDGRRTVGGTAGASTDSEAKRARKTYDKFTTEYSVVRRFRAPIADSFLRLENMTGADGKSSKGTSPPQTHGHNNLTVNGNLRHRISSRNLESDQSLTKRPKSSSSQLRLRNSQDTVNMGDSDEPGERLDVEHQQQRPGSVAVVLADGNVYDEQIDDDDGVEGTAAAAAVDGQGVYRPNEAELLIRRMWDSREVAVAGD
ncbi:hypothetical protein AJ79_02702 [Helicocarpus griseus UAMH5409]|uniref:Uncharacterized protein n=1 Tax=Helicocarpus griseus UAMH5409 TaxID=1447875 RepID=A0A2B7Y161_9EURO|nr:hypothetical protein AJ79_02702 [Helicocarpus griseus UAMH5409]